MSEFPILLSEMSTRICVTLLHSLWQVAALVLLVWMIGRLWSKQSSNWSYGLHVAALVLSIASLPITFLLTESSQSPPNVSTASNGSPPPLTKLEPVEGLTGPQHASGFVEPERHQADSLSNARGVVSESADWSKPKNAWEMVSPWLVSFYAAGVCLMLVRLGVSIFHAEKLRKGSILITQGPLAEALRRLSQAWHMRVLPLVATAENVLVPKVVGLIKPTILMPAAAIAGLSSQELEMILAHELAHVRRYDMWVNLVQRLAEAALFFNPSLWLLSHRISSLREYCCDELACGCASARGDELHLRYAQALLHVVELSQPSEIGEGNVAALAASGSSPSELRRRVARLFGEPLREPLQMSRGGMFAIAAVLLIWTPALWPVKADLSSQNDVESATSLEPTSSTRLILQDEDGKRVPDASVIAHPLASATTPSPVRELRTSDQGELLLEHLANTKYEFTITAPGYQPLYTAPLRTEEGGTLRLTMIRSGPAQGIVRFADGTSAPNATGDEGKPQRATPTGRPDTISEEVWERMPRRLRELFAKEHRLKQLEAEEKEEHIELSRDWSLTFPEDVQENELAGVVVNSEGKPLAGALVDLYPAFTGHETTTNDQGIFRYRFEDSNMRRRGTVQVRFSKDGYSPAFLAEQALGVKNLRVVLNSKTYLEGQVTDKGGSPVPNATVIASHPRGWRRGDYPSFDCDTITTTDDNGQYRVFLWPETYAVSAISESQGVARVQNVEVLKNQGQSLDLRVDDGVTFRVKVLDAETNDPVSGLTLYHRTLSQFWGVSNEEGIVEIPHALPGVDEYEVGSGTPAMTHGYFKCPTDPFGSWWSPEARKPWHRKPTTEVGIMFDLSKGMDEVELFVRRGVIISGKVTDPDGNPVARATVAPARTGTGNSITGDARYSVTTKDDGTFIVCLPPSGEAEYNLVAHDGSYAEWRDFASGVSEPMRTKPSQRIENLDIQLHRPATVRGRVTATDGRSLNGLLVRAHAHDKRGNHYYDPTTKTDEDGVFELSFIRPGKHYIQVEPFWLTAEDGPSESWVIVDLKEGQTKDGIVLRASN